MDAKDKPKSEKNAIVVLGASVLPDGRPSKALCRRLDWAVELLKSGKGDVLVLSGGPVAHPLSEADAMAERAQVSGVPKDKIRLENQSRNTLENAKFCQAILAKEKFGKVLVVSDDWHLPRALRTFRHFGVEAKGSAAPAGDNPEPPWRYLFCLLREAAARVKYAYLLKKRGQADKGR